MSGIGAGRGGSRRRGRNAPSRSSDDVSTTGGGSESRTRTDSGNGSDTSERISRQLDKMSMLDQRQPPAIVSSKEKAGTRAIKNDLQIKTNLYGIIPPGQTPVFRYDFRVIANFGKASKELTKQSREDYVAIDRKEKCKTIFTYIVKKESAFFGNVFSLVYDRAAILYGFDKLSLKQDEERTFQIPPGDIPPQVGMDDKCTGLEVKIKPVDENFEAILGDFVASINPNLDQQDHSLKQFYELATSQSAFFGNQHVTYGSGQSFLLNPEQYGFTQRDTPDLGDGKYLGVGSDKSIRFIEGPKGLGNVNCAMAVDTKKTAFHKPNQNVVDKASEILKANLDNPNRFLTESQMRVLKNQLKGLFVETQHGKKQTFQIAGLSNKPLKDEKFTDQNNRQISIAQYFKTTYSIKLDYTHLPCLLQRNAGRQEGRQEYSYFPMELCYVGDNQRVAQSKQTAAQMETMIKACAVAPVDRVRQITRNLDSLCLSDGAVGQNRWLANMQIRVTNQALSCKARQLPAPSAQYKNGNARIDANKGSWKATGMKYYQPASCRSWLLVGLTVNTDRYNITAPELFKFRDKFLRMCHDKGMKMPDPQDSILMNASDSALENMIKRAGKEDLDFVFMVQNDNSSLHNKFKLLEVQHQVVTQDLKMSTAKSVVFHNKMLTLENIVNKTNIKLGGLNYNILLESQIAQKWLSGKNRLIIGLDVSHPPPLTAYEVAKGMKPKTPSIVGYAANTNKDPVEFVGDADFQEARREEVIHILFNIGVLVLNRYKQSNGKLPSELIVYRDGVSEGQYKTVIQQEAPMLHAACKRVGGDNYRPKLVVIVAQKNHNVRFLPSNARPDDRSSDQNTPCGTILDQFIVHPNYTEFYLNSHRAPQGMAKTPRYTVLVDDGGPKMSADELQGLTYALCFNHQIVTMAISLPAPVYIAHLWAKRGKNNYAAFTNDDLSSDSALSSGTYDQSHFTMLSDKLGYSGKRLERCRVNA